MTRRGHIVIYFEQGWEGRCEWAFEEDNPNVQGGVALLFLQNGQRLNIIDIWQGIIDLVPTQRSDTNKRGDKVWAGNKQNNVPYDKWFEWFTHQPPLRAELAE